MNKRIGVKKTLTVVSIVIILIIGYIVYNTMNTKINETVYYVKFDSNGGSRVNTLTVKLNEVATKPEDPERKNYKFKYWALNNVEYNFDTKVRNNINLVAIWEKEDGSLNENEEESEQEKSLSDEQ